MPDPNAVHVVTAFANRTHLSGWGEAAHDKPPSHLMFLAADAHWAVAKAANDAADALIAAGFLPSHAVVRRLRDTEDLHSREAMAKDAWANDLAGAEWEHHTGKAIASKSQFPDATFAHYRKHPSSP